MDQIFADYDPTDTLTAKRPVCSSGAKCLNFGTPKGDSWEFQALPARRVATDICQSSLPRIRTCPNQATSYTGSGLTTCPWLQLTTREGSNGSTWPDSRLAPN